MGVGLIVISTVIVAGVSLHSNWRSFKGLELSALKGIILTYITLFIVIALLIWSYLN